MVVTFLGEWFGTMQGREMVRNLQSRSVDPSWLFNYESRSETPFLNNVLSRCLEIVDLSMMEIVETPLPPLRQRVGLAALQLTTNTPLLKPKH